MMMYNSITKFLFLEVLVRPILVITWLLLSHWISFKSMNLLCVDSHYTPSFHQHIVTVTHDKPRYINRGKEQIEEKRKKATKVGTGNEEEGDV